MGSAKLAQPLFDHRRIGEHPSVDRAVVYFESTLSEHLLKVSVAERVAQVPRNRLDDQPRLEMSTLESSLDWRFSFSAMAFRIICTLHDTGTGISQPIVNMPLTKKICDTTG